MRIPPSRHAPRERIRDGTTVAFLVVGLIPVVGLVLLGTWPRWEVGAGTAIALLAGYQLFRGS
jgi:hypothetical protein